MTETEALTVMGLVCAAFPAGKWDDPTIEVWTAEVRQIAAAEGLDAARAMIRGHKFPTMAAFFAELAQVRERHLDTHRSPDFTRPALEPAGRLTREENKARLAEVRQQLAATIARRTTATTGPERRERGSRPCHRCGRPTTWFDRRCSICRQPADAMAPLWARIVDACRVAGRDLDTRELAKFLRVEEPQITACVSAHSDVHVHPTEPDRPSAARTRHPLVLCARIPAETATSTRQRRRTRRQCPGQTTLFDAA